MNNLLESVKLSGQDFEWYPTTRKMLEVVAKDIRRELDDYGRGNTTYSVLDIGAGNGSALKILRELTSNDGDAYAIEKSKLLIDALPADVFVIGTDFHMQTLIDKQVDVIFCNPPYSEYETWMQRIVAEANCKLLYMVVPERWKSNKVVAAMIGRRCGAVKLEDLDLDEDTLRTCQRANGKTEVLASMSFEDSEFRQARAQIDIVKIRFQDKGYHGRRELETDPFDIWFESTFAIAADRGKGIEDSKSSAKALHELVQGQNLIERLEELYREDFAELLDTYRALEKLDPKLFKELGVDLAQVKGGLKAKVAGLKNLYWQELFGNLETITARLTSASREKLLRKLTEHTSIDFTAANAYAVVVWAIKNANAYFDNQLLELYLALADRENIRNYKSNQTLIEDGWRYQRKEYSHYTLDYRLVLERHSCFSDASYDRYDFPNGLSRSVHALLNDICTVAENLGFDVTTNSFDIKWTPGRSRGVLPRRRPPLHGRARLQEGNRSHPRRSGLHAQAQRRGSPPQRLGKEPGGGRGRDRHQERGRAFRDQLQAEVDSATHGARTRKDFCMTSAIALLTRGTDGRLTARTGPRLVNGIDSLDKGISWTIVFQGTKNNSIQILKALAWIVISILNSKRQLVHR